MEMKECLLKLAELYSVREYMQQRDMYKPYEVRIDKEIEIAIRDYEHILDRDYGIKIWKEVKENEY
jgi:hypothetical protein